MKKLHSLVGCAALIFMAGAFVPAIIPSQGFAQETTLETKMIKGKVLETMNSGGYTYLQVETADGPLWAAVPQSQVDKGQEVVVNPGALMENFPSKTLNRTFEAIVFSSGLAGAQAAPAAAAKTIAAPSQNASSFQQALQAENSVGGNPHSSGTPAMGSTTESMKSGGSSNAVVPAMEIKVEKAAGGHTVGELYQKASELNGKTIQVRGKVVKISRMIMGKNWLHIQDGTGNAADNSHDLVVTTMAEPAQDSVVLIEGKLVTNKDFGFGYKYSVLVEDAVIK